MAVPNVTAALSKIIISHCRKTILLVVYAAKCIMSCVYSIHCVSKNAPTLASCSLAKQHQYTFKDDMHIQLSLSLHFYLLYLLLRVATEMTRSPCWRPSALSADVLRVTDVSVAVKLGCTELFFVEPGLKVDSKYYGEVLLKKQMLPVMRRIAGNTFVFRAPARRCTSAETVQLIQQETSDFLSSDLWPPNSPVLNPVDYRIW